MLVCSAATDTPMVSKVGILLPGGGVQQNLSGVHQIGLIENVRIVGFSDVIVENGGILLGDQILQSLVSQHFCHHCGGGSAVVNSGLISSAKRIVFLAAVHGIVAGNVLVAHQIGSLNELGQIGNGIAAVRILHQPCLRVGVSGKELFHGVIGQSGCGGTKAQHDGIGERLLLNKGVEAGRDVVQNLLIVVAGGHTVSGKSFAGLVDQTQAVDIIAVGFSHASLQSQLQFIELSSAAEHSHIAGITGAIAHPGIGQVAIGQISDGAVALCGKDIIIDSADVAAIFQLGDAGCTILVQVRIVFFHVAGSAQNGAHLTAAGGADRNDALFVTGDDIGIEAKHTYRTLQVDHGSGGLAQSAQIAAACTAADVDKSCGDVLGIHSAGNAAVPSHAIVKQDDGCGVGGISAARSILQIGGGNIDVHELVIGGDHIGAVFHSSGIIATVLAFSPVHRFQLELRVKFGISFLAGCSSQRNHAYA